MDVIERSTNVDIEAAFATCVRYVCANWNKILLPGLSGQERNVIGSILEQMVSSREMGSRTPINFTKLADIQEAVTSLEKKGYLNRMYEALDTFVLAPTLFKAIDTLMLAVPEHRRPEGTKEFFANVQRLTL
jgi:hypothetical protein